MSPPEHVSCAITDGPPAQSARRAGGAHNKIPQIRGDGLNSGYLFLTVLEAGSLSSMSPWIRHLFLYVIAPITEVPSS